MERRLARGPVALARLSLEQGVEVGVAAVNVGAALHHKGFEPRGGVTEGATRALNEVLEVLLPVAFKKGGAFQRAQLGANADGLQIVEHGLGEVGVGNVAIVLAGIKTVCMTRLG